MYSFLLIDLAIILAWLVAFYNFSPSFRVFLKANGDMMVLKSYTVVGQYAKKKLQL